MAKTKVRTERQWKNYLRKLTQDELAVAYWEMEKQIGYVKANKILKEILV